MTECHHYLMYFYQGRLTCSDCGKDCTPLDNVRIQVVQSGYRDNLMQSIIKIVNPLPDDILKEVTIYAEYLMSRRGG